MKSANTTSVGVLVLVAVGLLTLRMAGSRGQHPRLPGTQGAPARQPNSGRVYSESAYDVTPLTPSRIDELASVLTPEERRILLGRGTERAFCGGLLENKEQGNYTCRLCGLPLFSSEAKFTSGTGWPSFFQPADPRHVHQERDTSGGIVRSEIRCARCGSHLGHVFEDGPPQTGLRYCVNSAALRFYGRGVQLPLESRPIQAETAYFAGGCFWGIEDRFQQVSGVLAAVSGYMGGTTPSPTYEQVCSGKTGHAEAVRVTYDPTQATYRQLVELFFKFHDPVQLNRQGPDIGTQYRSGIFVANDAQLTQAKAYIDELQRADSFRDRRIVTQVEPAARFYEAEEYHQDYHAKHGGSCKLPE